MTDGTGRFPVGDEDPGRRAATGPPAESRHGHAVVVGQARGVQQRGESYGESGRASILNFRLERYDDAGNRLQPVPVQMRSIAFDGALNDGDQVRVSGRWKHGTLHSKQAENLTTGAVVKGRSGLAGCLVFLAVVIVMITVFAVIVIKSDNAFSRQVEDQKQSFCDQASQMGSTPPGC